MIIDKIERKRNKTIVYSGENVYEFLPEILSKYDLKEGETDGKRFFEIKNESDRLLCKRRLYSLIDRTEKSKEGYVQALTERGFAYPIVKELTDEAEQKGWIDDRRFAECYLHTHRNNKGWFRLAAELKQKGVSEEIVSSFREEYGDHVEECKKTAEKLMRSVGNTYENRQKVYAKLLRKGFGYDEISVALASFDNDSYQ